MESAASMTRILGCLTVLGAMALGFLWPPLFLGVLVGLVMMAVKAKA